MSSVLITSDEYDHFCAMQWKPIETAPKDGTGILVYSDGRVISTFWSFCAGDWVDVLREYTMCNPTHWMPLPTPPKGEVK